jgi:predicted transglutaminase-like cysteine proteinase
MIKTPALSLSLCLLCALPAFALDSPSQPSAVEPLSQDEQGQLLRFVAWKNMLQDAAILDALDKVIRVNDFFNLFPFTEDQALWGEENYWATPIEFIRANGGDCEDFSIAKYFALLELGIPEDSLRFTMVKSKQNQQFHMVLSYFHTQDAAPLVLDNLIKDIKPASQRQDLVPVYSFNGQRLWLNDLKGGEIQDSSTRLKKWQELSYRHSNQTLSAAELRLAAQRL